MSSVIATVQSIVGQVFAVSADGARRLLVEGDRLFKGEEVLTGDSGMVTLKLADGRTLDLGRDSQWSESDARLAAQDAQAAQQVVSPGDEVAQLQQAIEAGMDPTQTLEATAAGPSAAGGGSGGAGGGHSFVMLDATGEVLEATVGFETSGLGDFAGADEQIQEALPNQAPEFLDGNGAPQGPLSLQTAEDTPISGAFNTRDVNGDLVTLTVTRAPTNGTLVLNANGTWTYTPSQDYNGTDSFEVTASDGRGASTPLTVNLTITPVNDAPVATGTYDATIDDSAAADTFADIKGQLTATDVDDTVLTWSGSATGAYGELTVNPDGSYTYVVDAKAVNGLQEGEQASDSFVVTVRDPSGASDTRVITINFNGANDTPIATASSAAVTEDQSVNGTLQASDADKGAVLSYSLTGNAPAGFVLNAQTGEWSLDAGNAAYQYLAEGQKLTLTVPFEVSDQLGAKTSSTLTITVTGVNDAAVLGSANVQLTETDAPLSTGGTLAISDVDSPNTFVAQSNVAGTYGTFNIDAAGNWTYVANSAFNELNVGDKLTETFEVSSADGTKTSVTVTINGSNDAAILSSANVQLTETDAPLSTGGTLAISDVDSPNTFVAQSNVAGTYGTFNIDAAGNWTYVANSAFNELNVGDKLTETFEVSSADGTKTSVTVTINGSNDAAILSSANVQLTETDAPLSTGGTLTISDVDSPATFVAQNNVAGTYGTFNIDAAGNWTYLANSAFNELNVGQSYSESFKVTSADGTETSVTVTINGTNDAAVLSSANVQLTETDAPLTANGTLTISDVDSPATFVTQSGVAGQYGTFSIDAAGNWSFVAHSAYNELNVGQAYSESFEVESADGTKTSVTVTINGSNDRPVGVADHVTLDEDTTATGNVLSNDTDVDNTSLTVTKFSLTNLPFVSFNAGATADLVIGKLTIQANGDFTFVPAKDYNGPVPSITYTLSDGSATSTATLTFDIKPVNDAPVNTTPGAQTLAEDSSKTFSLLNGNSIAVSDVDGDRLTTTLSVEHGVLTLGPLKGGVSFSGNGTGSITLVGSQAAINLALQGLKYVPGKDYNGQDTLTINTTDGKLSDSDSVILNITPVNDAPVATPTTASTLEDAPVIGGKLAATDVDGDTLTYSAKGTLPGGFTLNSDGTWTLDPSHADYQHLAEGKSTTLTINFTATDGKLSGNSTLTITVTGVNDKPTITAATAAATEGNGEINGQIAANDVDDGAVLSFSTTANVAGLTLGTDGKWTFDANNSAYDYLKGGEELVITVPVTVTDEHGASADSTLTITLTGTNDAPVANAVSASGNEDQAARIQVNLSGSDVDGTITGFTIGSVPANGTLYAGANGGTALKAGDSVTGPVYFVPNKDWNGTTTFEYSAVDNDGATSVDKATATITIAPVNDRPVGVNDSVTLDEDTTATGNVLSNDKDVDGDTLTVTKFSITGLPFVSAKAGETLDLGVGKLTIKANGDFTFVPAKDYNGPVPSVTYTLSDGSLTSTATLRFDITPVNDAPVNTTPGAQTLNEDGSKVFSIFGSNSVSVSDVDGDRLTTTLTVEHGVLTLGPLLGGVTFSGNGTGSITLSGTQAAINAALQGLKYVPAANYNGQDTLTISTSDGKLSDIDSITLNITPVNDAPVATPTSDSTVEDAPAIGGKLAATDVDGDVLTFTLKNAAPAGFSLNADGSWTFDPSNAAYQALGEGEKLVIQIPFTATDGSLSSSSTLTITVTGVNDVPTVTGAITYGTNEDAAGHVIDLLANASDADAMDVLNAVNITETSGKDASGVTIQGNTLVVDPSKYNYLAKGESVVLTYEYQVSDGKGGLVTTSATVTIDGVNDAPVVSSAIVVDSNEDAAAFNVDLLANATDVDLSDVLGISNLKQVGTQDASGVTLSGNGLQVNPNAYNYLAAGEKLVLTYSYDVVDNNGGVTPTTATITIEGRNDAPVLESTVQSGSITERADGVPGENAGSLTASGDIGFSDADLSNTHTVGSQLISAKDGKGLDVDVLGNLSAAISDAAQGDGQGSVHWNYSVAAGALDYLGAGETVTLVYRVTVTDSSGASASRDVTITLTGSNDAPIVSGVATTLTNEDEAAYSLDLLQHASDEDANDILSVDNLQLVGGGNDAGVTFDAASNSLQIDPSQYNYLAAGEKVVLNYSYEVSDGKGGVVSANASVTIEGRNDAPVVTDTSVTVAEESVGTPLNIAAPTDVDSSDVLTITVTGLPTVGTVTLANGTPVSNGQTLTSAELQGLKYNGPDDYKAGDPVGNFTYSVNDGTTSVEGKVTLGVTPVNDAPDANDDFGVIAGLKGNYYGYREGVDGGNLQNLAGVAAFIASRTPSATFTATELNYGNGVSNNLGNDQQLQKFLGADAASLNTDPANTSDAIIEMNGQINLNAGTYQFRVTADDGYSILVDGKVVAEFNGNQSPTARESATFTITESGPHDIQIIYWDQGGQAQLKVELRPEGGSYTVVGGAQLSQAGNDLLITNEDQPLTIEPSTLLGNDSDVDGDTLSIVSVQDAVNGSVALVNGKVVFTPDANFNGKATFTYTISDGNGKFDTATVTVGVKPVNDAPVSAPQSLTTAEDTAVDGKITATDVDGDTLTYSIASGNAPQHGTVTLRADGTFTYVPGKDYNGQDSFTVTISDGKGGTTTSVISLDITPVNDLPVTADQTKVTDEDQSVSGQIVASDADGDKLSYVIQSGVAHGSILLNTVTGAYTYTPNKDYNGTDSFTIRVYDPKGGYADSVVNITINPVNDAPVSGPQSLTTDEDVAVSGKVNAIDVDGDALTYSIANGNGPQHGTVTLNADGTFNYVPNKDYNGQDRFTVTISDGKGGTTTSVISLDITPVNDLPVTADQTKVTDEDQSVSGQIAASDVDGDKLTYTIQSGVAHGSILLNTVTGAYTYTPNKDFNGTDSFTIRVYDPKGGYADSVVTVTVNPVNDAPVASPSSISTDEDTPVDGKITARDVDGDTLTYSIANGNGPQHGTVVMNADGSYTYQPAKDFNGSDSFTVTIDDGNGGTTTSVVSVTVKPVNDAPTAAPSSISTDEDTPVNGSVVGNDVDGDTLTYSLANGPQHGSLVLNANGTYTYQPAKDFHGSDSFTVTIDDGNGGTTTSVVTVTVNPVNDAPVANDDSVTTLEDTAVTIDVLANDTDVDGDSLLISGASAGHGSVSVVDGKLVYTPTANYSGSDTISYSISDGKGGTSTASVQVTVTPVADAPNLSIQTPAGTPHATGLTLQSWNGLALGSSGNGATPATLKATIDAAGTPASSTSANDAHLDNVNAGVANKFSGLIYLQAGETYTFSGVGDDSVLVSVGGTTVASATWSGNTGQFSGSFTAQQSGYYTLDIYQHNQSGPGNLDVNVKVGNGPVQDLSTANVLLYRDTTDLTGDGVRVSELHGSDGKGYYQVYGYNEGDENSSIPLSHLSASLVDTDLSESLSISISQIPSGVTISDGTPGHSFTADGTHSEVDISGWNLSNLSLTSPNAGSFDLKVTATATEGANGDKASTSLTLPVVVHGVNDAPTSADNTVNTNEDTPHSFSSADFVFNDVDAGDSLKAIRINSLPASGNLSLGNEAVTIGMIITAAQIASLVYTPAANASGNSSFSFSVQDQSGAFSTTPNTMTIQVAAVDDAPGLSNSTVSFAENIASGSTIADLNDRFTGTDQDRDGEPLFYSITGGNDAGLFAINSSTGVITLASGKSLDYETATQHQLQVTATDGKTPVNATVTVNVTNVNDNGVVISDANPAANTVVENAANGATVGLTVLGRDGDVGATITKYELTDNAGGRFAINASTGVVTVADGSKLDYESATSHNITVKVTSSDGSTNTQVFTINLSNVNDNGITLTDANTAINSVAENATNGTLVGITALGVDGDAGTTVTYSLTNNAGGRFAIDATTGVVTVADGSKLDYENATSHSITVLATSSDGSTQSANYSIAVTNVNEAPVVVAGAAVTGNEDSNYIFKWSDFKVSDVDANSSLSIKIESLPGEGKLQVKSGNNWVDVNTNATVTKSVIDGGGLRFVPDSNESGHDSFGGNGIGLNQATYATFNYSGSDGSLSTASSTMGIDITPVADVPTLSVKSAAKSTLFTTTWESAPDSDYTSESIKGSTFENWTLVTTGDKRTGGTNVFEVWGHNDNMENQAGNLVTIKMPGTGNNDALELNDAGGTMAQTLGITRNVATEVGKVYDLSMDYAGRLGFDTTYTKIAVYLGSTLVGEYGSSSSQTSLNWENIHFSFVGTGSTEALTIKLAGTSTHESGRGALIDNITLSSSQGVVAGDGGVNGKTSIALANYISGALTDTDGSESLRYDLSNLPAGASIVVGNSTLAAVNGVVSLSAAQLATAKLQVSGAVRGEIGLDVKAVSVEPNGSTESTSSQHLTLKIVEGGISHDSLTTNTITVADTSSALSSGLTGEYWGYQEGTNGPNLTSLSQVEAFIESRTGNTSSLVGSNDNAAASSVNATFIANQINYGLRNNGNTVFSDDLGDNRTVTNGNTIGSSGDSQNNLYDFLTAAGTGNVSSLKAGGANLGDTSDAIIRAHGFLSVNAGTYDIRITADDGYRLMIGGQDIANVDKIQSTTTDTYKGVSIAGGLQALELLYWDQGGAASLKVEFKLSGSADNTYKVLGSNGLNLYQAPGEGQELVQTNTGWAIHTIGTTNGGDASDLINGSKYSDILNGGNGHDVLYGNGGHDLLNGGDGNDLLIGGVGNDTLIGGAGADTFMWKSGDFGNDVIKDFNAAEGDRIDISDLLPDTANANNLLDYLKVDTVTNTLQVSTTGDLANNVDVTIKLEGVNLSQYGATSSQIVNSLVAGADPLVKTEHH
ncbi:retention module-containing protein [Ectopseudomonas mendocina]|uniref:retention module-containing protein n=3 Tax=Ectopseudomonas mendocina TaxID=300 RepID=UPI000F719B85|nr:retention module-containing protein [Pseudomonas mendocina]VEE14849.1 outer membrane adhesin like protein [Pseudomonas mendocina]